MVSLGSDVVAAQFTASGSVSLGGNETRVVLTVKLASAGLDSIGGQLRKLNASLTYNLRVDPNANNAPAWIAPISGVPVRGSVSVSGLGSSTVIPGGDPTAYSVPLPPGIDGAWVCTMQLLSLGEHLGGTAGVLVDAYAPADNPVGVPTTRVMSANVSGKYNAARNETHVVLTPFPGSKPLSLQIYFVTGAASPSKISGKILGQTVQE